MKNINKFNRIQIYLNGSFWLFLTYLLSPYFYFLIFLKRKQKSKKSKILVIQIAKIGDVVCTTPVFREIKRKFPTSCLDVLILSLTKDILINNPHINETILITDYNSIKSKFRLLNKLRKEKYDWVINLDHGSFSSIISFWSLAPNRVNTIYKYSGKTSALLSVFNNYKLEFKRNTSIIKHYLNLLKFMGIENSSEKKEVFIKLEEEKKALDFLQKRNLKLEDLLIGISVVPGNKSQAWDLANFAKLADMLSEKLKAKIIFTGSPDNQPEVEKVQKMMYGESINSAGYFKLHELPALLKNLKLFISVDSGPVFIADALDIPVIDIVGPWGLQEQVPSGKKVRFIQKKIDCYPCSFIMATIRSCKEGHRRCVNEVTPEEVFKAAVSLL